MKRINKKKPRTTMGNDEKQDQSTNKSKQVGQSDTSTDAKVSWRQPYQADIMREIGYQTHTDERNKYWQSQTEPTFCYSHRTNEHRSEMCISISSATTKSKKWHSESGKPESESSEPNIPVPRGSRATTQPQIHSHQEPSEYHMGD